MLSLLRVLGRIPTGSAFAALPLAAALTAATQHWCWLVLASAALLGLTLGWTFAPWIPVLREGLPAHRRFKRLEQCWVEGHRLGRQRVGSDADLASWRAGLATWQDGTSKWIEQNVGFVEAERFASPSVTRLDWVGAYAGAHSDGLTTIKAQLGELIRLRDAEAERLR